ncbi:MAG: DUF294 nucleotidyltransferase-like domain-containing protein [Anaeromyxobacteraceae bacterium]
MGARAENEFLRGTAPFSELPPALFEAAVRSAETVYHAAGARLVTAGGPPFEHLYVIVKGAIRIERRGEPLNVLEEGESFGFLSLLTGKATLDVVVEEDLVAYRIPSTTFRQLLADARFARHFAAGTAGRLKASLAVTAPPARADLALPVERLVRVAPAWVDAGTPVWQAAALMRDRGISSVLVRGEPPGIVTDRDLRSRVLAEGRAPETPVEEVTTRPLRSVPAETPVHEAFRILLEAGVHHLPVERAGEIEGVVTANDLLRASARGPVELLRRVAALPSRERLGGHGAAVADMASGLQAGGLDAATIAGFVARVNDALLHRILRWAEADLGPPPAPFAWIVFGSEGRAEQTLLTDQDNALVYDDAARAPAWFHALAERVVEDLAAAGFPPCPGGYMATNHCAPRAAWLERFRAWIDAPTPAALLESGVFMDFRRAAGSLDLAPLEAVLGEGGRNLPFLRFLARSALDFRPPSALVLRLRGEASVVDLKREAIAPVVFLARCYALEAASPARATLERLEAATRAGLLDRDVAEAASEAFRFLLGLRLRRQLDAAARGTPGSAQVPLADLTPIERARLKDGLRAVRSLQEAAQFHFRLGGMG